MIKFVINNQIIALIISIVVILLIAVLTPGTGSKTTNIAQMNAKNLQVGDNATMYIGEKE